MHAFLICGQDENRVLKKAEDLLRSRSGNIAPGNRIDLYPSAKKDSKVPTLTIEDVRFISGWLSQSSPNPRAVVVHQIQAMTIPAQQAFLKTLEEPGGENRKQETENNEQRTKNKERRTENKETENWITIVLTADSETSLLPTIRSRCKIIRFPHETSTNVVDSQRYSMSILQRLTEFGDKSPSERLTEFYGWFSEYSGKKFSVSQPGSIPRPDALKFMEYIIDNLHFNLTQRSTLLPDFAWTKSRRAGNVQRSLTICLSAACLSHRRLKNNLNVQLALQQFILDIPAS